LIARGEQIVDNETLDFPLGAPTKLDGAARVLELLVLMFVRDLDRYHRCRPMRAVRPASTL